MRLALLALALCATSASAQKRMVAHVPWTGADTCLLTLGVTASPLANAGPSQTVSRAFAVTVDTARGVAQYGHRVCIDDPAQWPAGYITATLRLRREHDGATSEPITERFGPAPAHLAPPTALQ